MEEISTAYMGIDGPLQGFLWRQEGGIHDVMYVSRDYLARMDGNPLRDWPTYNFHPLKALIIEEHSPW